MGRLLEVRAVGRLGDAGVDYLRESLLRLEPELPKPWVTVVDARETAFSKDSQARGMIEIMLRYNSNTERAAYLLGRQSLTSIQVEAMILQARNPERRAFRVPADLLRWMSEVCTPEESARLAVFLAK